MYSVFLSSYTNTRESLGGELEKAVETLARAARVPTCSRIIYLIYLMLISLFSFVVFNVSVCVYFITYRLQFVIYM